MVQGQCSYFSLVFQDSRLGLCCMTGMYPRPLCVLCYPFSLLRKRLIRISFLTWDTRDWSSEHQALVQGDCIGWHCLPPALSTGQGHHIVACCRHSILLAFLLYRTEWLLVDLFQCCKSLSAQVLRLFAGRTQISPFTQGNYHLRLQFCQ